uniref:SP110 nuclear body protein n=1 Tax=Loxodonta africana TaxID=9785 RepID=G3UKJ6_LOXAF
MFTVTRALEEALFQHFICQKLEIAYAIHKPFPFFEGLRDKFCITEKMYKESLEACQNLVPVSRVVHNVLTQLERRFHLSFLMTLFSPINLREYPDLMTIYRSFKRGNLKGQQKRKNRPPKTSIKMTAAPADPAEGSSNVQPPRQYLLPQLPLLPPPPTHPPRAPRVHQPEAYTHQSSEILGERPSPSGPAGALPEFIQEGRITPVLHDNLIPKTNDKDSQEMPSVLPDPVQGIKEDSPEPNGLQDPQKVSSTPPNKKRKKRKRSVLSTPEKRHQKKIFRQVLPLCKEGVRVRETWKKTEKRYLFKATSSCHKQVVWSCLQRSKQRREQNSNSQKKTRLNGLTETGETPRVFPPATLLVSERPEDETVGFHSAKLPVTCGEEKGVLYTEKMKRGPSEKCIRNEKGAWYTPKEFAISGNRAKSKNWKQNVLCRGQTLGQLLEKGLLLCPSRISLKEQEEGD